MQASTLRTWAAAAVLALLLAACGKTPEQWLAKGRANAAGGRHAEAVAAFDKVLENPGSHAAEAQLDKARSLYALKRWDECARAALASTTGQAPGAAQAARVLALQALAQSGDKAEGARVLALLGPSAAGDPAVQAAVRQLGLDAAAGNPAAAQGVVKGAAGRKADLSRVNAVQVDIGQVTQAPSADPAQFPLRTPFQDPRVVVKVPSPDGKSTVWRALDPGKGYYLYLAENGQAARRLDKCKNGYQPVWSPDGRRILYSAMDWRTEERNLFIYDLKSGSTKRAFNASKQVGPLASWSPDGSKIVFTYFGELWIMNADGIGRGLLNLGGRMKVEVTDAGLFAWSRDGSRLAYGPRGEGKFYLMDLVNKY